jgi:hypothetical protein
MRCGNLFKVQVVFARPHNGVVLLDDQELGVVRFSASITNSQNVDALVCTRRVNGEEAVGQWDDATAAAHGVAAPQDVCRCHDSERRTAPPAALAVPATNAIVWRALLFRPLKASRL